MKFDKPLHMNILIQYPATLLAVLLPTTVNAQLILVPHEIDVKDVMQPRQVRLTHNGEAVLPSEILSVSSGVFKTGEALPKNAARNPQGVVVSQWSDTTNIIEAISTTVRKGYQVPFSAPSGYSHVSWSLNDKIIAEKHLERSNRYTQFVTFRNKGRNTLTCLASDSETGDFRRITLVGRGPIEPLALLDSIPQRKGREKSHRTMLFLSKKMPPVSRRHFATL